MSDNLFIFGIILELLATFCGTIGKQLIRWSAMDPDVDELRIHAKRLKKEIAEMEDGPEKDKKEADLLDTEETIASLEEIAADEVELEQASADKDAKSTATDADTSNGTGTGSSSGVNEDTDADGVKVDVEELPPMQGDEGDEDEPVSEVGKMMESVHAWAFYIGLLVNVLIGPLLEMAAYAFAAQSLLAPFGGLDTVWNALLAPWTLGEKLTTRRILGIIIIMTGTIGSAVFSNHDDKDYTAQDFKDLLITWRTLIYIVCFSGWFCVGFWLIFTNKPGSFIRGLMLGVMGGSLAGNMFFVKIVTTLFGQCFSDGVSGILDDWLIYICLILAVAIAVTNVQFLTKGMLENEALFMVTCFEGSMITASAGSGVIVLQEMDDQEGWKIACYAVMIGIVIAGLLVLVSGEYEDWDEPSEAETEKEPGVNTLKETPSAAIRKKKHALTQQQKEEVKAAKQDGQAGKSNFVLKQTLSAGGAMNNPSLIIYGALRQSMVHPEVHEAKLVATATLRQSKSLRPTNSLPRNRARSAGAKPSQAGRELA